MLSCIYCFIHSNDKSGDGIRLYKDISHDRFLKQIALLVKNGLRELSICGCGEPTLHSSWRYIFNTIFDSYPDLNVLLVSNFMNKFTDADFEILMRFNKISISCDTLDPELFAWLRRGGNINILLDNISKFKEKMAKTSRPKPQLILNATESNVMLDTVEDLAKYAVDNEIGLQFSNLLVIKDSFAEKNRCITKAAEILEDQVPAAWEHLCDLPARIAAQSPGLHLHFGPMFQILEKRAEALTLNKFVPSEEELFYRSFALSHIKNPEAFLLKLFLSFSDCLRGILITQGATLAMALPYSAARLRYRAIWFKAARNDTLIGAVEEAAVGSHLTIIAGGAEGIDTHVFLEVYAYEPCDQSARINEAIALSEPKPGRQGYSNGISHRVDSMPSGDISDTAPATSGGRPVPVELVGAADFLNARGELELQKGHNDRARVCFRLALEEDPAHVLANANLGTISWQEGNHDEALRHVHSALDLKPEDFKVLRNCYKTLAAAGDFEAAIGPLKSYLQRKPCDDEAWEEYASMIRRT